MKFEKLNENKIRITLNNQDSVVWYFFEYFRYI